MLVRVAITSNRIPAAMAALERMAETAVAKGAADILADAVQRAPHDTGNLKASGYAQPEGRLTWRVGFTADYAAYQELGTSRMRAQPFLVPATHAGAPRITAAMRGLGL